MKISNFVLEELPKAQILKNPEIIYEKVKEEPFIPFISNNVCIISTKLLRDILEDHVKNIKKEVITDSVPNHVFEFGRDHFIDEDWTLVG